MSAPTSTSARPSSDAGASSKGYVGWGPDGARWTSTGENPGHVPTSVTSEARDAATAGDPSGIDPRVPGALQTTSASTSRDPSDVLTGGVAGPYSRGSRTLEWSGQGRARLLVSGGSFSVDTSDLYALSVRLTTLAGRLDTAATRIGLALADAQAATPPPAASDDDLATGATAAGLLHRAAAAAGETSAGQCRSTTWVQPTFEMTRSAAVDALTDLRYGTSSLASAADALRSTATDIRRAGQLYDSAEDASRTTARLLAGGAAAIALTGPGVLTAGEALAAASRLLGHTGKAPDGLLDVAQSLRAVLDDPSLGAWARSDLLLIAVIGAWAQRARSGTESDTVEKYLATTALRLDPSMRKLLPSTVMVGSRTVATSSLTPMQRVAYYLSLLAERSGDERFGRTAGVRVTAHGAEGLGLPPGWAAGVGAGVLAASAGLSVTVPRGTASPFGLAADVAPMHGARTDAAGRRLAEPPGTVSEVIDHSADLKDEDTDISTGVVSVIGTTHSDGRRTWLVIVPGTTDWGLGGSNPQDMQTNLQAVAGRPTDMETAVVTAMRRAGVRPGEDVGLYGHSQGAITAANIAADPAVRKKYAVTALLTAGGPTAGAKLPSSVKALHLENNADAVPALDAAQTPRTPTRTVVTVDTRATGASGYPHDSRLYASATRGMKGDPDVDAFQRQLAGLTGAGEKGTTTTETVFDVERVRE